MLQKTTIKFVKDLQKNNNKPWFDANRKIYEAAREDFAAFIDGIIRKHGKKDPLIADQVAKNCMFRINRDVRFAKDKSPYKKNFAASINQGGKKSTLAGYYFHMEPGNRSFSGGGVWQPQPAELAKIRQEIDYNLPAFKKIVESKKFQSLFGGLSREDALSRVPKGYEADNPAAEYLKLKSFIAMVEITDEDLASPDLAKKIIASFEAMQPLNEFLNEAMQG
jgi:uncharacterized protein (TIGR02453 family)